MKKHKSIAVLIIFAILSGLCSPFVRVAGIDSTLSDADIIKIIKFEEINESNHRKIQWKMQYNPGRKQLEEKIVSIDFKEHILFTENGLNSFKITTINGDNAVNDISISQIIQTSEKKENNIYDFHFYETKDSYEILFETVIDKKIQGQDLTIDVIDNNVTLNQENESIKEETITETSVPPDTVEQEPYSEEKDTIEIAADIESIQMNTDESIITESKIKSLTSKDEDMTEEKVEVESVSNHMEEYFQSRISSLGFAPMIEYNNISYISEETIGTYPFPYKDHNNIRAFDDGHYYVEYEIGTLEKNAVETDADNPDEYEMELVVYGKSLNGVDSILNGTIRDESVK